MEKMVTFGVVDKAVEPVRLELYTSIGAPTCDFMAALEM